MAKSKSVDRPAGMDNLTINQPKPTQRTPVAKSEMGAVVGVAAGPVDSAPKKSIPGWPGKGPKGEGN